MSTTGSIDQARLRRIGALVLAALAAGSCRDPSAPLLGSGQEIIVAFDRDTSGYPGDNWYLRGGALDGDTLELEVAYPGGCREHRFWLLAVHDWIPLPDSGPVPTFAVGLRLAHDAAGDPCEAIPTSTLRFGLRPLGLAYRFSHGPGPARLLLQITQGRDGFAVHVFDWGVGG